MPGIHLSVVCTLAKTCVTLANEMHEAAKAVYELDMVLVVLGLSISPLCAPLLASLAKQGTLPRETPSHSEPRSRLTLREGLSCADIEHGRLLAAIELVDVDVAVRLDDRVLEIATVAMSEVAGAASGVVATGTEERVVAA